ncbi:cardiolipin synthetase [Jannaschia seosinensis]|uniref:Phospholipase D n=1 Tax=Jannaschia seosinensis TaxID=313367 RepID=A0A0M7B7F6_9RHOB|nr:phospholipase D family protein [Jannaschia seosinensis]CUH38033.1 cardiolipin synthetase [Jannaschia seosinensis]
MNQHEHHVEDVRVFLTGSEAFPELERLFLNAKERVTLSFRIFDPSTRLHSPEAREIGEDWFDLVVHTLQRGVRIRIVVSDFDPVIRPDYHQRANRCVRQLIAAGEASGRPDLIHATAALHPARVGWLPGLALWPSARAYLLKTVKGLNAAKEAARRRRLSELPRLRPYLRILRDEVLLRPFSRPQLTPVTHHQKLALFDGEQLYIGGLDLNDRRYDTLEHKKPGHSTWHDIQLLVRGPAAQDAETHLESFLDVVEGGRKPPETPHILRTLSAKRRIEIPYMSPRIIKTELADAHHAAARSSERLIYIETQFLRDRPFSRTLEREGRRNPNLNLIVILPAAPEDVAFQDNDGSDARFGEYLQARCVMKLQHAFGDRLFLGAPAQTRKAEPGGRGQLYGAPLIYVHAKVSIFDDRQALVSSANLNGRSFKWDTEAGVKLERAEDVRHLRHRCMSHWLGGDVPDVFDDPARAVAAWRDRARANARRDPAARHGFILPYSAAPARRFGRHLPGIPEEMV